MTYAPLRRVILDPALPSGAKVVWTVLVLQAEETGRLPFSGTLAAMCGLELCDVRRGLADLRRARYTLPVRRAGLERLLLYPAGDAPDTPPADALNGDDTLVVMAQ